MLRHLLVVPLAVALVSCAAPQGGHTQPPPGQVLTQADSALPFLCTNLNRIEQPQALARTLAKLKALEAGQHGRVRISHLGDSHVQADWWTGPIRRALQAQFGNGGRGVVFPYSVAGTNGPPGLLAASNTRWQHKRSVHTAKPQPVGLVGHSMWTADSQWVLVMGLEQDSLANPRGFDALRLFLHPGPDQFTLTVGVAKHRDSLLAALAQPTGRIHRVQPGEYIYGIARQHGVAPKQLMAWNGLGPNSVLQPGDRLHINGPPTKAPPFSANLVADLLTLTPDTQAAWAIPLPMPTDHVVLRASPTTPQQRQTVLHGLSLELRRQPGLIYDVLGSNGAQAEHALAAKHLLPQLAELNSDLIILSYGTNEAYSATTTPQQFQQALDSLIRRIRRTNPQADLLLTTPPDVYFNRVRPNPKAMAMRQVVLNLAHEHGLAYWDFYEIMGGYGCMRQWRQHALAQADHVHFNQAGYAEMGRLFVVALLQAYAGQRIP